MSAKLKKGTNKAEKVIEPEWDPWYVKMLDAVGEYMDTITYKEEEDIDDRDIRIIQALIDFYGFDVDDMADVLDDIETLEKQRKDNETH